MTKTKYELPEVGTHVKLTEEYAQKCQFDPAVKYTVTGKTHIGRAPFANVIALNVDNPAAFRVHPKYLIIVPNEKRVTSHSACDHPSTKSARAKCRKQRNA